jgi:hypothetical protein
MPPATPTCFATSVKTASKGITLSKLRRQQKLEAALRKARTSTLETTMAQAFQRAS